MSFLNEEAKLKNHEIVQGLAETVRYLYDLVKKKFTKYDSQLVK